MEALRGPTTEEVRSFIYRKADQDALQDPDKHFRSSRAKHVPNSS